MINLRESYTSRGSIFWHKSRMDDARVPTSWQPRGVINLYSGHIAIASHGWKFAVYSHRRMIKQQTMGRHRCSRFVPPSASAAFMRERLRVSHALTSSLPRCISQLGVSKYGKPIFSIFCTRPNFHSIARRSQCDRLPNWVGVWANICARVDWTSGVAVLVPLVILYVARVCFVSCSTI